MTVELSMPNRKFTVRVRIVLVLFFMGFETAALGSGFAILEQGVAEQGNANAGGAAAAHDASTVFFNPAGLIRLKKLETIVGSHVVIPSAKFRDTGSGIAPGSLGANTGGDAGITVVVPNFYVAWPVSDRVTAAFGVYSPYGLKNEYDDGWIGRYHAVYSELTTINVNPAFAFRVTDRLSLGVGASIQLADAELSKMIDYGALMGIGIGVADGKTTLKGDDTGFGFNGGLLYEFNDHSRVGLHYRSRVQHKLSGTVRFDNVPAAVAASPSAPLFINRSATANFTSPETLSGSVFHQIDDSWSIMADITWTRWSRFRDIDVHTSNPPPSVPQNWENSMRYSLGAIYRHNDKWTFRGGLALDESPVPNSGFRSARIPDEDRLWVSGGMSYHKSEQLTLTLAYVYIFVTDPVINNLVDPVHPLVGQYDAQVNIVSAQLKWAF